MPLSGGYITCSVVAKLIQSLPSVAWWRWNVFLLRFLQETSKTWNLEMEHLKDQSWRYHFRSWAVEELDSLEFRLYKWWPHGRTSKQRKWTHHLNFYSLPELQHPRSISTEYPHIQHSLQHSLHHGTHKQESTKFHLASVSRLVILALVHQDSTIRRTNLFQQPGNVAKRKQR